jgi:hypothetical protein
MDPGLAAILGVIVGGLIGLAASLLSIYAQARIERARWLRDEKKRIYVSMIRVVDSIFYEARDRGQLFTELGLHIGELSLFVPQESLTNLRRAMEKVRNSVGTPLEAKAISDLANVVIVQAKRDVQINS